MSKKVIVMGKGSLAIKVADWFLASQEYELVGIVPVVPEPNWTESIIAWAEKNNVSYVASGRYQDIPGVKNVDWTLDLAFSVFYDKIIKPDFISKCKQILNLHNAPLPKYRGVRPINWALKNNEKEHGVTIHQIIDRIDAGPIVAQIKYPIDSEKDEVIDVYNRALDYGWQLFCQTMPELDKVKPKDQEEVSSSYYSGGDVEGLFERKGFKRGDH